VCPGAAGVGLGPSEGSVPVCCVQAPGLRDGWNGLPGHPQAADLWFRAVWSVTSQKTGASALGVQRVLGWELSDGMGMAAQAPPSDVRPDGIG